MLPPRVSEYIQQTDKTVNDIHEAIIAMEIQHVFANHVALKAAGLVEIGVKETLHQYSNLRGNRQISKYVSWTIERNNSLDCEKIQNILDRFDKDWWGVLKNNIDEEVLSSIDSLKTLRDQIAHGKHNGTGLITVDRYYKASKKFVNKFAEVVLTHSAP